MNTTAGKQLKLSHQDINPNVASQVPLPSLDPSYPETPVSLPDCALQERSFLQKLISVNGQIIGAMAFPLVSLVEAASAQVHTYLLEPLPGLVLGAVFLVPLDWRPVR